MESDNPENSSKSDLSNFFKMPVGIQWVGQEGTILKVTRYELEMLGYSSDELVGKNLTSIHVDKEAIDDILQKVKMGVELHNYKTQLRCKDGSIRHVLMNSEVKREDGEYIHTRFFVRDITERGYNELSNALLAAIIDHSNDAIISKDLNGIISSWNNSAERIFGYTAAESIGKSITIIIPDERLNEESEILSRIRRGERVDHFETIREHKDGSRLHISLNISPIKDSRGKIVGASKIARNITKRKQAEAEMVSYQEQLRALASKLSKAKERERQRLAGELHDNLAQLLSMSKIKLDELTDRSSEDYAPELDELTDLIYEANNYTRKLMSELKPPPVFEHEHLGTALEWIAEKMEQYNLNVIIEDDKEPKPLKDEVQIVLLQSVRELLFNVIKHAAVNEAKITHSRSDDEVQVTVTDQGNGFNPQNDMLFSSKGGGFGLFNVIEQIDLLGGNVEIDSKPGKGTIATITVPLKNEVETEKNSSGTGKAELISESSTKSPNGKIKVLLVDDHKMMRKGIRKLIESENDFTVVGEASDGKKAVEMAQETLPNVIIMDVNMPDMNGIEATKQIISGNAQTTVIGLSVHDNEEVERAMKKAGASVYLTKNEVFETLCATIRNES